jgi:hypothetical protein
MNSNIFKQIFFNNNISQKNIYLNKTLFEIKIYKIINIKKHNSDAINTLLLLMAVILNNQFSKNQGFLLKKILIKVIINNGGQSILSLFSLRRSGQLFIKYFFHLQDLANIGHRLALLPAGDHLLVDIERLGKFFLVEGLLLAALLDSDPEVVAHLGRLYVLLVVEYFAHPLAIHVGLRVGLALRHGLYLFAVPNSHVYGFLPCYVLGSAVYVGRLFFHFK